MTEAPPPADGCVALVTNPRSRRNKLRPGLLGALREQLGPRDVVVQAPDLDALDASAVQLRDRGVGLVAINGGDGTVHRVLTALARAYGDAPLPRVALLCGGTMNTVARGVGLRGEPVGLLARVLADHRAGALTTCRRSLMCVDGSQVGFLFGTGLIARFLEHYYSGRDPNPWSAAWLLGRAVVSTITGGPLGRALREPLQCRVLADGEPWLDGGFATVAAGTVDDIGLGFRPFFKALDHPGQLHAVGVADVTALVGQLPRVFTARPLTAAGTPNRVARSLEMHADAPIAYMIDGDFHRGGQSVRIEVGPAVEIALTRRP